MKKTRENAIGINNWLEPTIKVNGESVIVVKDGCVSGRLRLTYADLKKLQERLNKGNLKGEFDQLPYRLKNKLH